MGLFNKAKQAKQEKQTDKSGKILNNNTPFLVKEAYKMTRTNILFSMPDAKVKTILFTSAFPSEGKTTTAINIAISFAELGHKVLLIDSDIRKSTVRKRFKSKRQKGLSDALGGLCTLEEVIIPNPDIPNLYTIQSGTVPPNPSELLASQKMKEMIDKCATMFDYVFIDTPPANVVTDAVVLSTDVAGVIIVVRANYSDTQSVGMALNKFKRANANMLGFILNDSTFMGYGYNKYSSAYSSRYMDYRYAYSYEYGNNEDKDSKKKSSNNSDQ